MIEPVNLKDRGCRGRLLRVRGKRPRHRAAEKGDELASLHDWPPDLTIAG